MAFVEDFFDILKDIHCKEKRHIGSKKTLEEVHAFDVAFLAILLYLAFCFYRYLKYMKNFCDLLLINSFSYALCVMLGNPRLQQAPFHLVP